MQGSHVNKYLEIVKYIETSLGEIKRLEAQGLSASDAYEELAKAIMQFEEYKRSEVRLDRIV